MEGVTLGNKWKWDETGPAIRQIELKRIQFAVNAYIDGQLAKDFAIPADVRLEEHVQFSCDSAVLCVRQSILGRELERIECRYPADWWQAFKARWFPAWALRRWPVKETVKELVARELYPKMANIPGHEAVLSLWES